MGMTSLSPDPVKVSNAVRDFYELSRVAMNRLLKARGASTARMRLLGFIDRGTDTRAVDIVEAFGYAPRTVTVAIDALERLDLIRRTPSVDDRRAKVLAVTEAGREILKIAELATQEYVEKVFTVLSNEEHDDLARLLNKLNSRLKQLAAEQAETGQDQ
jgi:DNA-binding MarR family transcriptional regulator